MRRFIIVYFRIEPYLWTVDVGNIRLIEAGLLATIIGGSRYWCLSSNGKTTRSQLRVPPSKGTGGGCGMKKHWLIIYTLSIFRHTPLTPNFFESLWCHCYSGIVLLQIFRHVKHNYLYDSYSQLIKLPW